MSIQLPGWVQDAFNLVGLPWPGIDEDQLRAWASDLRSYDAEINTLSGSSRSAVAALASSNSSSVARTLAAQWDKHARLISDLRGPMDGFADALDVAADAVVAQKLVVIGAAVTLAGEVIATQGEALLTFGLAEAEVPAEVAVARLAVKAALQELEGQLIGTLINKAAAEISGLVGGTIGGLIDGGAQVVTEAVTLKADYQAMTTLSSALSGHASRVETASTVSWRKAGNGSLAEGGPGGGWAEVARAVEQTVLQVLRQLFVDLAHALWKILSDTAAFLKKAVEDFRSAEQKLTDKAEQLDREAGADDVPGTGGETAPIAGSSSSSEVDLPGADPDGVPLLGGFENEIQPGDNPWTHNKSPEADLTKPGLVDKPPHPGNAAQLGSYDQKADAAFRAEHGISEKELDASRPPNDDYRNFSGVIRPVRLEAGTKLYRVVGNTTHPAGGYWTPEPPDPATWRHDLAVLHGWNGNGAIETAVLDKPVTGWAGTAASQAVRDADRNVIGYYPGGAQQLYVNFFKDYPKVDTTLIRSAKIRSFGG